MKLFIGTVAVLTSLYHLYAAFFGAPPSFIHRPMHVGLVFLLFFLTVAYAGGKRERPSWALLIDRVLALSSVGLILYYAFRYDWLVTRFPYVTPLGAFDVVVGLLAILLVIEVTRRSTGPELPLVVMAFLLYGLFGQHLPGLMGHSGLSVGQIIEVSSFTLDGLWGTPVYASSTYVYLFTLFGAFLAVSGVGKLFSDLALSATRGTVGGAAKAAVVASAGMGTISGSSTANVVTTGTFTIPLMTRQGYRPTYAAAVEAVASTGGQLMPPVMGVAAFLIVEYTGIPYVQIMKHALIPAILYFLAVFIMVHLEALKLRLNASEGEHESVLSIFLKQGYLLLPLVAIVYMLVRGFSPQMASSIGVVIVAALILAHREYRTRFRQIFEALAEGAHAVVPVVAACASAGIIVGIVARTGLGYKLSGFVISLAGGSLLPALLLTALTAIILGMGLPSSAAYIIMASLMAPALVELGIPVISAHMFVFYFACLSSITPPVALAAFAAAGVAGTNPTKTGFEAAKIGSVAFIVPFMFVYGPVLLLVGDPWRIAWVVGTAVLGVVGISIAMEGWSFGRVTMPIRLLFFGAGLLLVYPSALTSLGGFALLAALTGGTYLKSRAIPRPARDVAG